MKLLILLTLAFPLLVLPASDGFSWQNERPVTPYGDFCPKCSRYGICSSIMTSYDSESALKDYYEKKGLDVKIEKPGGRFIKARIVDKDGVVDVIIFDRGTGRIRSIY
ncbi:MAG: hypothetical protein HZA16_02255 [Nitrospirae bacterium]|nr:hypothetical protein [Nitrospirota bacterium]